MSVPVTIESQLRQLHIRLAMREGLHDGQALPYFEQADPRFLELRRLQNLLQRQGGAFGRRILVRRRGVAGWFEQAIKTAVRKLLRWYAWPQMELNAAVVQALAECIEQLTASDAQITSLRRQLGVLTYGVRKPAPAQESCAIDYYFKFEERFRGNRELIRKRQEHYVSCFDGSGLVLDMGCGRGEFMELLREAGIACYGVDVNIDMADHCRRRGLHVVVEDAIAHLESLPDASIGGIYAAQIIEHFLPTDIVRMLRAARDCLIWEGVLVIETPNPICEEAMRNFFIDPTHIRPVHPELLRFLAEEAGLHFSHFIFGSALEGVEPEAQSIAGGIDRADLSGYRDYAVVLYRK
jgi:SAM-dependent methyltransferase